VSSGLSILRPSSVSGTGGSQLHSASSTSSSSSASSFIGFSWGPTLNGFPEDIVSTSAGSLNTTADAGMKSAPRSLVHTPVVGQHQQTPVPANHAHNTLSVPPTWGRASTGALSTPHRLLNMYSTPMKPYALSPYATLPRTSTVRRTAPRRTVSDREAMKQLVDCVGMSARQKVLESGKKPRILTMFDASKSGGGSTAGRTGSAGTAFKSGGNAGGGGTLRKELRFDRFTTPIPGPDYSAMNSSKSRGAAVRSNLNGDSDNHNHPQGNIDDSDIYYYSQDYNAKAELGRYSPSSEDTSDSEGGHPPSPSPSPRPGSAMSMTTMLSRRSGTPTTSGHFNSGRLRSGSGSMMVPVGDRSATATTTTPTTTGSGLLSIPSAGAGKLEFKVGQPSKDMEPVPLKTYPPKSSPRPSPKDENKQTGQPQHIRSGTLDDVFPDKLREMERRHATMMRTIEELEDRFAEVSSSLSR